MAQDRFRRDARDGQTLFTAWLTLNSPFLIEVIGRTDSILIDQQHGLGGHDEMVACLTAAKAAGVYALVRVADNDFWSVGPSMLAPKASCAL